jgi:NADH:ubiquinone oxidoreductase subunit E
MEVYFMITIQVCIGSACHLKGSYNVINRLQEVIASRGLEMEVDIKAAFCLGECTKAVSVKVGDNAVESLDEAGVEAFIEKIISGGL